MKRDEILAKIAAEPDGEWKSKNGLRFTQDTDGEDATIHVKWKSQRGTEFGAFLMKHAGDSMEEFYMSGAGSLKDANDLITFLAFLSADTGAGVKIDKAQEVEKVVEVRDEKEEARMRGQIEVYERLLPASKKVTLE